MRFPHKLLILAASLGLFLGGCGANFNSVYRSSTVPGNQTSITLIDAKQRAILTAERPVKRTDPDGKLPFTDSYRAFCTEPSPDVFSVLSMALSGGASFGQDKVSKTLQAAVEAAFSSSEIGTSIARTQTINMLREMMYRTCERYLSGALGGREFPIQAARDQRLMVSILAIEQLTGVITPKPIVIASNSSAAVGQNSSAAILAMKEAQDKSDEAEKKLKKAEDNLTKLEGETKECTTLKKAADEGAKFDKPDEKEKKDKLTNCNAARQGAADAKDQKEKADKKHAELASVAENGGIPASAISTGQFWESVAGGSSATNAAAITGVADVVKEIVLKAYEQDEFLLMCVRELPSSGTAAPGTVQDACLKYITASINLQASEKEKEFSENVMVAMANNAAESSRLFDKFWAKVEDAANTGMADPSKLKALVATVDSMEASQKTKDGLAVLSARSTKSDIRAEFQKLQPFLQKKLAE